MYYQKYDQGGYQTPWMVNYIRICCFWSVPFPLDVFITQLHNILEKKTKQEHVVDQDGFPECFRI